MHSMFECLLECANCVTVLAKDVTESFGCIYGSHVYSILLVVIAIVPQIKFWSRLMICNNEKYNGLNCHVCTLLIMINTHCQRPGCIPYVNS